MLRAVFSGLCDLVYPPQCLVCQNGILSTPEHLNLCQVCSQAIVFNRPPFCLKCSSSGLLNDAGLCQRCRNTHMHFDRAWNVCLYNDHLRRLLHMFKYGQKISLRREFARWILDFAHDYRINLRCYDLLVPVPLHSARLRERGYNQAQLIAETISQPLGLVLNTSLKRIRHTPYQARCSQKQRWTNISGAFRIKHPEQFKKKTILVVDDLLTTGATLSEAAKALKTAGACRVDALTLAAAEMD